MQAIIMAAGRGSRLGSLTEDIPKAFLEINGIKLIEYNIALLHAYGVKDIIIVTGYQTERFEELVRKIDGIKCVFNPFYEMVNVLGSFYMAQEYLWDDTVYMHADTLCSPRILEDMLTKKGDIILPIDFKSCDEEAMKVQTNNGIVTAISKNISCNESEGEFIGIAKISKNTLPALRNAAKKLMEKKQFNEYFEGAIQELIESNKYKLTVLPTANRFWVEIDFKEDYEKACAEIEEELLILAREELEKA